MSERGSGRGRSDRVLADRERMLGWDVIGLGLNELRWDGTAC